jgi:hypothetical protein
MRAGVLVIQRLFLARASSTEGFSSASSGEVLARRLEAAAVIQKIAARIFVQIQEIIRRFFELGRGRAAK